MSFKTGTQMLSILYDSAYFLLAVMVEGDESSRLRMANSRRFWPATGLIDSPVNQTVNYVLTEVKKVQ